MTSESKNILRLSPEVAISILRRPCGQVLTEGHGAVQSVQTVVRGDRESSAVRDFAACTTDHFSLFMNPESTQTDFVKLFQEECFRMRAIATTEVSLQSVI